ncbi:MAG TPA: aspartate kinase, partial [Bacteroidia bacterium]
FKGDDKLLCVVSAMGKTTNALELVLKQAIESKGTSMPEMQKVYEYHKQIIDELELGNDVLAEIDESFLEMKDLCVNQYANEYNYFYDQVVSLGEILSTKIVARYLQKIGVSAIYKDGGGLIRTDSTYREGKVNWTVTEHLIQTHIKVLLEGAENANNVIITQGFTGKTSEGSRVTLGREGSDYSAAIFAYCLGAEEVTIWKDVPGVLNADPKIFPEAQLFNKLSYTDAIELAYYGATVIHPKTIKPLQNKNIVLRVRSFVNPTAQGTIIDNKEEFGLLPSFIFKKNQALLSLSPKDFSFVAEENLAQIFGLLTAHRIKVNLMQNSAISFSLCIDNDALKVPALLTQLHELYNIEFTENLELITIRNYNEAIVNRFTKGKTILAEQKNDHTVRFVIAGE